MKILYYIIKKYYLFSILSIVFCILCSSAILYLHEKNRTDIQLIDNLNNLINNQASVIHIPSGWEIIPDHICDNISDYSISFAQSNYLQRQIIYNFKIHDISFCISKISDIDWTLYHTIIMIVILLVVSSICIMLFFVIKMYLFSKIWKQIFDIQTMIKTDNYTITKKNRSFLLSEIIVNIKNVENLKLAISKEFHETFIALENEISIKLIEKKIPELVIQEFQNLNSILKEF
jgi:hypothetical protein